MIYTVMAIKTSHPITIFLLGIYTDWEQAIADVKLSKDIIEKLNPIFIVIERYETNRILPHTSNIIWMRKTDNEWIVCDYPFKETQTKNI